MALECGRIAERWPSGWWDSLVANGSGWHDRFLSVTFTCDSDSFSDKERVARYFEDYAEMIDAPVRTGVTVEYARPHTDRLGFLIETSHGTLEARHLVSATGPLPRTRIFFKPWLKWCSLLI